MRLRDEAEAGNAVGIGLLGGAHSDQERQTIRGGMAHLRQPIRPHHPIHPGRLRQRRAQPRDQVGPGRVDIDQRRRAVRGHGDRLRRLGQDRGELRRDVDDPIHRLVTVIRPDQQQHVLSRRAQPLHRLDHQPGMRIHPPQQREMRRRTQFHHVLRMVGFGGPELRERRLAAAQDLRDKSVHHGGVTGQVRPEGIESVRQRLPAWGEAAHAVVQEPEPVRVVRIGRPRRDVAHDDGPALARQPLRQRRHVQAAAGHTAPVIEEAGLPRIVQDLAVRLLQDHGVGLQPMPRRQAAGGEAGRHAAGHGREHRPVPVEPGRGGAKARQMRHQLRGDEVPPQPVQNQHHGASHRHSSPRLHPARPHGAAGRAVAGQYGRRVTRRCKRDDASMTDRAGPPLRRRRGDARGARAAIRRARRPARHRRWRGPTRRRTG